MPLARARSEMISAAAAINERAMVRLLLTNIHFSSRRLPDIAGGLTKNSAA
jgi:hypothetical protein